MSNLLQPIDLSKLDHAEPTRWLIEPILGRDALTLLVGEGGVCKSWLALDLAICLAAGLPTIFDSIDRPSLTDSLRVRILYLDEDGQVSETKRRLDRLIRGRSIDRLSLIDFLKVVPSSGLRIDSESDFRLVKESCLHMQIDLIIIDALVAFHMQTENSNDAMRFVMRGLFRRLMRETGAGILLLHHLAKPSSGEVFPAPLIQRVRGGGEVVNASDCALALEASPQGASFSMIRSRFIPRDRWPSSALALTDSPDGSVAFSIPQMPKPSPRLPQVAKSFPKTSLPLPKT